MNTDRARLQKLWEKVHGVPDDKRILKPGADYEERYVSKKLPEPEIEYDLTTQSSDEDRSPSEDEAEMDPDLIAAINESMEDANNSASRQVSSAEKRKNSDVHGSSLPEGDISSILIEDSDEEMMKSPDADEDITEAVSGSTDDTPASTSLHHLSPLAPVPDEPSAPPPEPDEPDQDHKMEDYEDDGHLRGRAISEEEESLGVTD